MPRLKSTAWAWSSTWCRTTWACCTPTTPGGWTCSRRGRARATRSSSTSTGRRPSCCCRCWASTTARRSREREVEPQGSAAPGACAISTTAFPLRQENPASRRRISLALHRLLEQQHYRLAYWRVASDEINYRRFFEITDLAGVRVEDPEVFAATHAFVARLARRGGIDGLAHRPSRRPRGSERSISSGSRGCSRGAWIVVEKILADHEKLPGDWPVHGETGYRFANLLTGAVHRRRRRIALRPRSTGASPASGARSKRSRGRAASSSWRRRSTPSSTCCPTGLRASPRATATRATTPRSVLRKALVEIAAQFPGIPYLRLGARRVGNRPAL